MGNSEDLTGSLMYHSVSFLCMKRQALKRTNPGVVQKSVKGPALESEAAGCRLAAAKTLKQRFFLSAYCLSFSKGRESKRGQNHILINYPS